ncbi:LysM peptidoglycan-binding domain-containing protein [uncultured Roseovarius sp.]|uniref:LysM peptidoglycan-binding domain-containing protein n=1 Tax=uncultured Roseovarius sp. TaxID=293344 RepID=UPI002634FEB5|nr:LysM peptidoglycan-binding domain-containing protein [uncultured Roseovarius sp.]
MLRATLIAAGFFAITLALILVQPGKPRPSVDALPLTDTYVTRAAPDLSTVNAPARQPEPEVTSAPLAEQPVQPTKEAPAAVASAPAATTLDSMVLGALQQGQSETYIDALVNDAAQKGRVEVPQGLVTAEGRVDTALLLSALSQPARPRVPSTYTVATGDSLASIAYRFYGDLAKQSDIFAANSDSMQPTDRLRVGQVLNLPTP